MNLTIVEGNMAISRVHGVDIVFDTEKLGKILQIPLVGLAEYM